MRTNKRIVLVILPCLLMGGTQVSTLEDVKALMEAGFGVVVLCLFETDERVLGAFEDTGARILLASRGSGARPCGLRLVSFLYRALRTAIREYAPVTAHINYQAPDALVALMTAAWVHGPIVCWVRINSWNYGARGVRLMRLLSRWVVDAFIFVSRRSEEEFFGESAEYEPGALANGRRHFTIYNGVALGNRSARRGEEVSGGRRDGLRIGAVGRLVYVKGFDILLEAVAMVAKETIESVSIVGEGRERDRLVALARSLGVCDRVRWVGLLTSEQLFEEYQQYDVLVVPSRSEAFGRVAAEAMGTGIPVIASRTGGLTEIVEDGVSGRLVAVGDVEALAGAIVELAGDPEKRRAMGERGRLRAAKLFSVEKHNQRMIGLYSELFRLRGRRAMSLN